jgi:rhodanese-related sulfurtransferase
MEDISVKDLKSRLASDNKPMLIDVRETYENEQFNIGGKLIPLGTLPNHIEELKPHKDEEIVVYCRSGGRSGVAKTLLERAGFTKVRNLLGGMLDYQSNED